MKQKIYFDLLDYITNKGPLYQKEIKKRYKFIKNSQELKEILAKLVANQEVLSQENRGIVYYIAPAQLKIKEDLKYYLLGHPAAENILKTIGNIKKEGFRRIFMLENNINELNSLCERYGIIIRRKKL